MPHEALDLSRWQFAVTIIYHFLFVPVTIGMAWFVAGLQTAWLKTGKERYLRGTRFFGKLFLINFALGVVTGIVQEFQFGMNWSGYSRFVGDVFGIPLAMEAIIAFFLESTFLGLWVFGWDRLKPKLHLATIYLVALGTTLSAGFILAANSWMQNPVGTAVTPSGAQMRALEQVFLQPLQVWHFVHTWAASMLTAGLLVLAVCAYWLHRKRDREMFRSTARGALLVTLVSSMVVITSGHFQAGVLTQVQPMKIAAAEALYETSQPAPLSLFAVGPWERHPERVNLNIVIPNGLSLLATNSFGGKVEGINDVQRRYQQRYGPGDYTPIIGATYWAWRVMITVGFLALIFSAFGLLVSRRGRPLPDHWWFRWLAYLFLPLPFAAVTTGWLFTEMGRQPWIVQGLMFTREGVSPHLTLAKVIFSLTVFCLIYTVLGVIEAWLMLRAVRAGPESEFPAARRDAPLPPMLY